MKYKQPFSVNISFMLVYSNDILDRHGQHAGNVVSGGNLRPVSEQGLSNPALLTAESLKKSCCGDLLPHHQRRARTVLPLDDRQDLLVALMTAMSSTHIAHRSAPKVLPQIYWRVIPLSKKTSRTEPCSQRTVQPRQQVVHEQGRPRWERLGYVVVSEGGQISSHFVGAGALDHPREQEETAKESPQSPAGKRSWRREAANPQPQTKWRKKDGKQPPRRSTSH